MEVHVQYDSGDSRFLEIQEKCTWGWVKEALGHSLNVEMWHEGKQVDNSQVAVVAFGDELRVKICEAAAREMVEKQQWNLADVIAKDELWKFEVMLGVSGLVHLEDSFVSALLAGATRIAESLVTHLPPRTALLLALEHGSEALAAHLLVGHPVPEEALHVAAAHASPSTVAAVHSAAPTLIRAQRAPLPSTRLSATGTGPPQPPSWTLALTFQQET